jgi:hypothetical protein
MLRNVGCFGENGQEICGSGQRVGFWRKFWRKFGASLDHILWNFDYLAAEVVD